LCSSLARWLQSCRLKFQKRLIGHISVILGIIALAAIVLLELSSIDQILPEMGFAASGVPSFNTPHWHWWNGTDDCLSTNALTRDVWGFYNHYTRTCGGPK
jgi:hypothetical protein